jgi:hypothetical protein
MRKVPRKTGQIVHFEQQLGDFNPRQKSVSLPYQLIHFQNNVSGTTE